MNRIALALLTITTLTTFTTPALAATKTTLSPKAARAVVREALVKAKLATPESLKGTRVELLKIRGTRKATFVAWNPKSPSNRGEHEGRARKWVHQPFVGRIDLAKRSTRQGVARVSGAAQIDGFSKAQLRGAKD